MSEYLKIFMAFFKIGLFTFGGGYAMLPMFRKELIEKEAYISEEELMDYYSIGQCTPGIIAVNVATFTGYRVKGVLGAIVATMAIVLPSLVIIMLIASGLNKISNNDTFYHIAKGIRIGIVVLLLNEVITIFRKNIKNKFHFGVLLGAILLVFWGCSSVIIVFIAGFLGVVKYFWSKK